MRARGEQGVSPHEGESSALRLTRYFCNRRLEQPTAAMRQLLLVVGGDAPAMIRPTEAGALPREGLSVERRRERAGRRARFR
jgi:hypothetical protein